VAGELSGGELNSEAKAFTVMSLPLIWRPGVAALDMITFQNTVQQAKGDQIDGLVVAAEWIYVLVLVQAHVLILLLVFLRYERRWSLDPR
jgi:hypothetical protein